MVQFFAGLDEALNLYVRHAAWLNTTPDKPEGDKSTTPEVSRSEYYKRDGEDALEMPPCDAYYLILYLFELGPTVAAGMSEGAIGHSEVHAWQANTGIELNAWETRCLRRLSMVYLSESFKAKKPDCPAPWAQASYIVSSPSRKSQSSRDAIRALAAL